MTPANPRPRGQASHAEPGLPSGKSLVLDLLATLRSGAAMPVRALIEAGALFGIAENNIRVSIARLLAAGSIARDERGRYRLEGRAAATGRHIAAWRRAEEQRGAWDGTWWGVLRRRSPRGERGGAKREERALRLLGLRPLENELWIRPANLAIDANALRDELAALGLGSESRLMTIAGFEAAEGERALRLWDDDRLVETYEALIAELEASASHLPGLATERAMVESFTIGGRALRQVVSDPRLPTPIVPEGAFAALVETMRRYDRMGRDCWAPFLAAHAAPHRASRAPVDFRPLEPAAQALTPVEIS